ncbi:MAG: ATP-binding protein [Desertifilum sp.]|nr:ATP-binding protein [Desertifilum sp.]
MFSRSRRNLAKWFTLVMGSILLAFASVVYYLEVEGELEALDRLLYKKTQVMAASVKAEASGDGYQVNLDSVPLLGIAMPPDSGIVYARWYNAQGELVQFFGSIPPADAEVEIGFMTVKPSSSDTVGWLRQVTLPVYERGVLIGYLQVATLLAASEKALAEFRLILSFAIPITLSAIGLAGWWLGGIAMQPIRQSYDQLQRFTADASHELRTPMATILSNAQVGLLSECDPQQRLRLENIVDDVKLMSTLVSHLLFLARYQGQVLETLRPVDLGELVAELVEDYAMRPIASHVNLTYLLPESAIKIQADAELLATAIANLLSNACKYTPPQGQVELKLYTELTYAVLQVSDTGIGIAAQDLPHIFERFYRVDPERSPSTGGFGLGLAIAKQIVESHQGKIQASSTVGLGSTFQIFLPLAYRS